MDTTPLLLVALLNALGILGSGLFPTFLSRRLTTRDELRKAQKNLEAVFIARYPALRQAYHDYNVAVDNYRTTLQQGKPVAEGEHLDNMRAQTATFDALYAPMASQLSDLHINVQLSASVDAKMSVIRYILSKTTRLRGVKRLVRHPMPDKAYRNK